MSARIEFFFFVGSTYSYLSVSRAQALAERAGVPLAWRPFSVRTLMREQNNSPFAGKPVKLKYMWRDLERRAARFGVPFDGAPPTRSTRTSWPITWPRWPRSKAGACRSCKPPTARGFSTSEIRGTPKR
jgi:2-hydroxychromene-2-carboxylate isomerase